MMPGTTILRAVEQTVSPGVTVEYDRAGNFAGMADVGIAVVGEGPYAEGVGDAYHLDLSSGDVALIQRVREHSQKTVVILISGRPLVITPQLGLMDALVAAWLPGTEGQGITDVLFGDAPFTGKLPYTWPRWSEQLPFDFENLPKAGCDAPLFPFGFGLSASDPSPAIPDCRVSGPGDG
jgi:beta-glucosidase